MFIYSCHFLFLVFCVYTLELKLRKHHIASNMPTFKFRDYYSWLSILLVRRLGNIYKNNTTITNNIKTVQETFITMNYYKEFPYPAENMQQYTIPVPMCQFLEHSTWKHRVVASIPGLANLSIPNCLLDETLNRGPVWRCYTLSTLNNQTELSVVSSCILSLSPILTNRLLGTSLRWATGSDDK